MCDVGYLCANFSLPRPLCSRLRPDVRDRQTADRQTDKSIVYASPISGGHSKCAVTVRLLWNILGLRFFRYKL